MSNEVLSNSDALRSAWDAVYQINPIILQGGLFANSLTGMMGLGKLAGFLLPAAAGLIVTEALAPWLGKFKVLPGGNLVNQSVATYPFPNLQIAANATIQEPLTVSLVLKAPVHSSFGYLAKPAIFTALQATLTAHNNAGGSYIVMTPAFMYEGGLLLNVSDVSSGESSQPQIEWQFDFYFPLISRSKFDSVLNSAMSKFAGGQPITGQPSWTS